MGRIQPPVARGELWGTPFAQRRKRGWPATRSSASERRVVELEGIEPSSGESKINVSSSAVLLNVACTAIEAEQNSRHSAGRLISVFGDRIPKHPARKYNTPTFFIRLQERGCGRLN